MAEEPTSHLRNLPRQARSAARVELLLDVAEEVFEEVGYDAATTNLVASRAGVPVGTLYRWFPDKAALAEALTDRYLERLVTLYTELLTDIPPEERIGDFLHRVMGRLVKETRDLKALPALLVSAMVPGEPLPRRRPHARRPRGPHPGLIELRVPGIPDRAAGPHRRGVRDARPPGDRGRRRRRRRRAPRQLLTDEYIDVLLAYLEAKFPASDAPAWSDPDVAVKPAVPRPPARRAHRPSRLSARGTTNARPLGAGRSLGSVERSGGPSGPMGARG